MGGEEARHGRGPRHATPRRLVLVQPSDHPSSPRPGQDNLLALAVDYLPPRLGSQSKHGIISHLQWLLLQSPIDLLSHRTQTHTINPSSKPASPHSASSRHHKTPSNKQRQSTKERKTDRQSGRGLFPLLWSSSPSSTTRQHRYCVDVTSPSTEKEASLTLYLSLMTAGHSDSRSNNPTTQGSIIYPPIHILVPAPHGRHPSLR